jgi:ATP-dependent DNA helicase RecG
MADLAARLRAILGPLTAEYRTGCQNQAAVGGFDHHLRRLLAQARAAAEPDSPAAAHLDRLDELFAVYADLDIATRGRHLREAKRRLDDLLAAAPPEPNLSLEPVVLPPAGPDDLSQAVQFVKGVGPQRAAVLARLGIETAEDLLLHFPRRHEDRSQMLPLREAQLDTLATFRAKVTHLEDYSPRPSLRLTKAYVSDGSGSLQLVWFNAPWIAKELKAGDEIIFSGKVTADRNGHRQVGNPAWEPLDTEGESLNIGRLVPIYPLTEGLGQGQLRRLIHRTLERLLPALPEVVPDTVRRDCRLIGRQAAVGGFHFPSDEGQRLAARRRLVFEEFFGLQVALAQRRRAYDERGAGIAFKVDSPLVKQLLDRLPFLLTAAQQRVMADLRADMAMPRPMNRLIQGDVGSGKTLVALSAMLTAVDNGFQAAVMAPTEVLAEQHQRVLSQWCRPLGVEVELFTGRAGAAERRDRTERLAAGEIQIAVGTHALIQESVEFQRLGLVVVDEQHRFGVLQRQGLTRKGVTPDVIVMTATPIPRTLALTVYGDLDTSVIDELPPGRRPVLTEWFPLGQRAKVYSRVRARLKEGRQAYAVCPLVDESEKVELEAATTLAEQLREAFKGYQVGLLHGRLSSAEKDEVMTRFRAGEIQLLATTTVIEVGIDVANATVMLVVNAERFGLSQLHQLRGRVGRGAHQSECLLLSDAKYDPARATEEADLQYRDGRQRLRFMLDYTDGFKLAEADLELRGPGELGGTRQSGVMDLHVANLARDQEVLQEARAAAQALVAADPELARPKHAGLRRFVGLRYRQRGQLAEVG